MESDDWPAVRRISEEGIATKLATFETKCPEWDAWDSDHLDSCRLVTEVEGDVAGWAALSPVSDRCCYGGVAEVSVYVGNQFQGQGIGGALLKALIDASEESGIWTLQAGIFVQNEASIRLHERMGFRQVGRRERLGQLNGVWHDVVLLERRSQRVGN
jgi:phosphinothricin acetyltransferase